MPPSDVLNYIGLSSPACAGAISLPFVIAPSSAFSSGFCTFDLHLRTQRTVAYNLATLISLREGGIGPPARREC